MSEKIGYAPLMVDTKLFLHSCVTLSASFFAYECGGTCWILIYKFMINATNIQMIHDIVVLTVVTITFDLLFSTSFLNTFTMLKFCSLVLAQLRQH